jgi:hypothetical protein
MRDFDNDLDDNDLSHGVPPRVPPGQRPARD